MTDPALLQFLEVEMVCALSVMIDGETVHGAAMHFSYGGEPLELFFSSDVTQRKYEPIKSRGSGAAAVVIGFSEEKWVTCQMSGVLRPVPKEMIQSVKDIHYRRIPSAKQFENDPNTAFLRFEPRLIRLTDYNTDTPSILVNWRAK